MSDPEGDSLMIYSLFKSLVFIAFLFAYIAVLVGVPVWVILGIIWLIKRKNPSKGLTKAVKIVSLILLFTLPVWIFLFVLAGSTMTLM